MKAFNDGKAKEVKANKYDQKYNGNSKPAMSFFGSAAKTESIKVRAKKNGISADQQMWRDAGALSVEQARKRRGGASKLSTQDSSSSEKKFFGLF